MKTTAEDNDVRTRSRSRGNLTKYKKTVKVLLKMILKEDSMHLSRLPTLIQFIKELIEDGRGVTLELNLFTSFKKKEAETDLKGSTKFEMVSRETQRKGWKMILLQDITSRLLQINSITLGKYPKAGVFLK